MQKLDEVAHCQRTVYKIFLIEPSNVLTK